MFKELPHEEDLPDYFDFIKLPIAMATIRAKLEREAYSTVTMIESDVKRMVQNAKDYNTAGSDVYEDAERIRKLAYNFMKNNNPEYANNPDYVSFPTPLPNGATSSGRLSSKENSDSIGKKARRSTGMTDFEHPEAKPDASALIKATNGGAHPVAQDFTGKTFQQAQELLITSLLEHVDDR